jgi:hypothetical protein
LTTSVEDVLYFPSTWTNYPCSRKTIANKNNKTSMKRVIPVSKTQVENMIKSALKKDLQVKHTLIEYAFSPTTTPILINPISYPAQGIAAYNSDESETTEGQRIGNKIVPVSFEWMLTIYASATGLASVCRITLFEWLLPIEHSDMVPVAGDIYADGSSSYFYNCPLNFDTKSKYHILHDKVYTLVTGADTQITHINLRKTIKHFAVKEWKFRGDSESGTSAALIKGNLYAFFVSDGALETPDVELTSYLCYTD